MIYVINALGFIAYIINFFFVYVLLIIIQALDWVYKATEWVENRTYKYYYTVKDWLIK